MIYIHPTNNQFSVRVIPGKPHSLYPYQQKPYVIQATDKGAFDKTGNLVSFDDPKVRIPLEEFVYRRSP